MNFKIVSKVAKRFALKRKNDSSRANTFEQRRAWFSSENKDETDTEPNIKKILSTSSPLKPSPEAVKLWSTTSYVKGTVFQGSEVNVPTEEKDPSKTSIILFPGQGNQYVGMAQNIIKYPVVQDMFDSASEILGYDLLKLCLEGPEEKLDRTEYCQPATLVCSLGALEKLKEEHPWAINNCVGTCGYSLGEFSALVFGGCLNFEKAVHLVNIRAKAMELCCKMVEGGMMSIIYGRDSELSKAIIDSKEFCHTQEIEDPHCSVACYLSPHCKIIAGHIEALNYIIDNSKKYRLKRISKLNVSGAFHTPLMKEASIPFKEALNKVEIRDPLIKIYSNVNGKAYYNAEDIKRKLPKQIYNAVKWEQTMHTVYKRPIGVAYPHTYECGPGLSLTALLKKMYLSAGNQSHVVKL